MCEHEIVGVFSRFNVIIKSPLLLLCKPPLKVALVWNRSLLSGPELPGKNPQQGGQTFFRGFPRPLQFILDLARGLLQDGQPRNTYPWRYPGGILTRCRKAAQLAPPARLCFELLQKCLSSRFFVFLPSKKSQWAEAFLKTHQLHFNCAKYWLERSECKGRCYLMHFYKKKSSWNIKMNCISFYTFGNFIV